MVGCASTNFFTAGTVPWMELSVVQPLMATTMGIQKRKTASKAKRPRGKPLEASAPVVDWFFGLLFLERRWQRL